MTEESVRGAAREYGVERRNVNGSVETTETVSIKSNFISMLIGTLPIIGDILLYYWGRSGNKDVRENKKSTCIAYLLIKLVIIYPAMAVFIWLVIQYSNIGGF